MRSMCSTPLPLPSPTPLTALVHVRYFLVRLLTSSGRPLTHSPTMIFSLSSSLSSRYPFKRLTRPLLHFYSWQWVALKVVYRRNLNFIILSTDFLGIRPMVEQGKMGRRKMGHSLPFSCTAHNRTRFLC